MVAQASKLIKLVTDNWVLDTDKLCIYYVSNIKNIEYKKVADIEISDGGNINIHKYDKIPSRILLEAQHCIKIHELMDA